MDRENVIKELHDARRYLEDKEWSDRCASPHIDAINDAIALLKEQEPIKPEIGKPHDEFGSWWFKCGACDYPFDPDDKYCRHCGRSVKWEWLNF